MANIRLHDLEFSTDPGRGLGRLLRNPLLLTAEDPATFSGLAATPLAAVSLNTLSFGLKSKNELTLDTGTLTLTPQVSLRLTVLEPGEEIVSASYDRDTAGQPLPVLVPAGRAVLGLTWTAGFEAATGAPAGALAFGFEPGVSVSLSHYQPFAPETPFNQGLERSFRNFVLPAGFDDLETLEEGSVATVAGRGRLRISTETTLPVAMNPLALAQLPLPGAGPLPVSAQAGITIGVAFEVSGEYEVRVQKTAPDTVLLGWFRTGSREQTLAVSAGAGVTARQGERDWLATLMGALGGSAERELAALDLPTDRLARLEEAIRAGATHGLDVSFSLELAGLSSRESALLYRIRLTECDAAAREAVREALHGNLEPLAAGLPGIERVRSVFTTVDRGRKTLHLNLLGIFNQLSLSELIRRGEVLLEEATGQVTITDSATANQLRASFSRFAFGADRQKLRDAMMNSFLITAIYRSWGLIPGAPDLTTSHTYFELIHATSAEQLKDNLDVAEALRLISPAQKRRLLGRATETGALGRTAFLVELDYDQDHTRRLFFDGSTPRSRPFYEHAGRRALELLIQEGDANDYRRAIADSRVWDRLAALGNPEVIAARLPESGLRFNNRPFTAVQARVLASDYLTIAWWADAMARTAKELADLQTKGIGISSPAFEEHRARFSDRIAEVARRTKAQWGDPWGLVAMAQVLDGQVPARLSITGSALSEELTRELAFASGS